MALFMPLPERTCQGRMGRHILRRLTFRATVAPCKTRAANFSKPFCGLWKELGVIGLSEVDVALRLAAAMVAGMVMGLNRDLKGKPAGVRTLGLVGLGSALATMAASGFVTTTNLNVDAVSRAIQGIITGIGFLGAGVIFREQHEGQMRVRGLTTAASIWLTACFGMVCGIGAWSVGFTALVLSLVLLAFGKHVERLARKIRPEKLDAEEVAEDADKSPPKG